MFRYAKPRLGIFSTSRLPISMEARKQRGQIANVQRVHMRQPGFRWRPFVAYAVTIYIGIQLYDRLVLEPLDKAAEEVEKSMTEEELVEADKPLFIPFPGTTKELKSKPYRGTDPEWKEFVKFSKDRPLQARVRDELAQYVRKVAEKNTIIAMRCGKDLKVRRCWLDVDFPQHPPPEFERSGIEISDEAIAWATHPVDSLIVFKIRQVLWPQALVKSFWNFTKVLLVEDSRKVAGMLGIKVRGPQDLSIDQILARQQQLIKHLTKDGPPQPDTTTDSTTSVMKVPTPVTARPEGKSLDGEEIGPGQRVAMALQQRFFAPLLAFRTKLKQTWKPAPNYPPRGSILFSGMVELDSSKAYLVFDVKAAWDPKTKSFDPRSMLLKLRRFQWKAQAPGGGR